MRLSGASQGSVVVDRVRMQLHTKLFGVAIFLQKILNVIPHSGLDLH